VELVWGLLARSFVMPTLQYALSSLLFREAVISLGILETNTVVAHLCNN
jgi:hypothetical protein